MKAAARGAPPAWLSANSHQCRAFGTGTTACLCVVITERNRTMLFLMHTLSKQGMNLYSLLEPAFKEFQA